MINYLKDIKKETLIGLLPDVINSNNDSIRKEFNWIFDSSLNRLTKSVYAPTGSVKAHFGEFTNLACEYFTVKNVDSLKYSILDSVESIINETLNVSSMQTVMAALTNIANSSFIDPSAYDISALCDISTLIVNHNVLNNRFKDADFIDDDKQDFCHDAAAIVYQKENDEYITIKDALDNIGSFDASILEVYDLAEKCDASINVFANDIDYCIENVLLINTSINNLNSSFIDLNNTVHTYDNTINQLNSSVNKLNSSVNSLKTSVNKLNSSVNILTSSVNNLESSVDNIYTSLNNLKYNIIDDGSYSGKCALVIPNVYNNIVIDAPESDNIKIGIEREIINKIIENNKNINEITICINNTHESVGKIHSFSFINHGDYSWPGIDDSTVLYENVLVLGQYLGDCTFEIDYGIYEIKLRCINVSEISDSRIKYIISFKKYSAII